MTAITKPHLLSRFVPQRSRVRACRIRVGDLVEISGRIVPVVSRAVGPRRVELEVNLAEPGDRPIPFFLRLKRRERVVRRRK